MELVTLKSFRGMHWNSKRTNRTPARVDLRFFAECDVFSWPSRALILIDTFFHFLRLDYHC